MPVNMAAIRWARAYVTFAGWGLADDDTGDDASRMARLHNVVAFGGRAENCLGFSGETDDRLRSRLGAAAFLHRSQLRTQVRRAAAVTTKQIHLSPNEMEQLMVDPPPGASTFFVGDERGGCGWLVDVADGETVPWYSRLWLVASDGDEMSSNLIGDGAAAAASTYVAALHEMIENA